MDDSSANKKRQLFVAAAIAAALFGVLNLAVMAAARNTVPRQIARHLATPGLNWLALGNSLMEAGFDAATFQAGCAERAVALNAGMGSSYPVEHVLLLRRALEQPGAQIQHVLYGFFDLQLMEPPKTALSDLVGNRAMLYYFEPDVAASYYRWPPLERLAFHATRLFPAIEERGAVWAKVEKLRRRLGVLGMPAEQANRFGRVQDFAAMEPAGLAQFASECDAAVQSRRDLSPPVADMIRLARQHGARILMIEMPMSASHVERYYRTASWQRYRAYLRELLARHGAEYVEASEWVLDERLFADHVHLSPQGAVEFSRKLANGSCRL